jgi:ribosomal protein S27AE
MQRKKCPKCGAGVFYVSAHVIQDWEVDEYGNFINTIDDCVEVTHHPDDNDLWECVKCGCNAPGRDFNV